MTGSRRVKKFCATLVPPIVLLVLVVCLYWRVTLTREFTFFENPDLANQVLPWMQMAASALHRGEIPLWDPYLLGGQSFIGQVQTGVANPLNYLLWMLPLRGGFIKIHLVDLFFVFLHYLAAVFTYALCRTLRCGRLASIIGGLAFGTGSTLESIGWPQMVSGAVWIPLVFVFLLRAFRGENERVNAWLAGSALGLSFLGGHHQIPIFVALATLGFWASRFYRQSRNSLWQASQGLAAFLCAAFCVGAVQILPAIEYGRIAKRWVETQEPVGWSQPVPFLIHTLHSLRLTQLLGILTPGMPSEVSPYLGTTVVALAALAVWRRWQNANVRAFSALGLGALLYALAANDVFSGVLYSVVPGVEKAREPARALVLFSFAAAILAAHGVEVVRKEGHLLNLRRARDLLLVATASIWFLLFAVLLYGVFIAKEFQMGVDDRVILPGVMIPLLLAAWSYTSRPERRSQRPLLALLLLMFELGNVSGVEASSRFDLPRTVFLKRFHEHSDVIAYLASHASDATVKADPKDFPYNWGDWYGLHVFGGLLASLPARLVDLGMHEPATQRIYGVSLEVTRDNSGLPVLFTGSDGLKVIARPDGMPFVRTVHQVNLVRSLPEVRAALANPALDVGRIALVTEPVPEVSSCPGQDRISAEHRSLNNIEITADMACQGLLVIAQNFDSGWHAYVDGRRQPLLVVYGAIQGVSVDAGRHRIELLYRPKSVLIGALLSGLALLGSLVIAIGSRRRRRSRSPDAAPGDAIV